MKLTGRRESNHVDDRRGMSTGTKAGLGIGGVVIVALISLLSGGGLDLSSLMQMAGDMQGAQSAQQNVQFTPEEQELAKFSRQILAGTEDVWTREFKKMGRTYQPPTLVLYTNSVQTGCGAGSAAVGPFYCSADQCLYIDLSFFTSMKKQLGADGDFAYAYVIAHEVGHHVQHLLGTLDKAHARMAQLSQEEANRISVRIELQADFYAGVWAYHDNAMFGSIEPGDVREAIDCAGKIGDDYLQKKARGTAVPESFTHGTSAQRERWLNLGLQTGDVSLGDTFSKSDAQL
ncbi:MAG: neutral zinc metallopeptidase [Paludibacteraceae bacterium]|nr:neutral zinc metallopeptidase [Paludibacteraceae bacterium]